MAGTPAASALRTTPHSAAPSSRSSSSSSPSSPSPRAGASGSSGSGGGGGRSISARFPPIMALAETFQEIVDSLPSDWTDLEFDLRVDESRYIDASTLVVTVNAQPYSHHDWH